MTDNIDIWKSGEPPKQSTVNFGECELLTESRGTDRPWVMVKINIQPVIGSKFMNTTNVQYPKWGNNDDGSASYSFPWDSHVIPTIRDLVGEKKIQNAPDLNGKFVSWEWQEWLSTSKKDLEYWENRAIGEENQGKTDEAKVSRAQITVNEKGKKCAKKKYVHFLDIFADETACIAAYEERYGKPETIDDVPGFEDEKPDTSNHQTVAVFLAEYLHMSLENGKVNTGTFEGHFNGAEIFKDSLGSVESLIVQDAIKKANEGMKKEDLVAFIVEQMALPF